MCKENQRWRLLPTTRNGTGLGVAHDRGVHRDCHRAEDAAAVVRHGRGEGIDQLLRGLVRAVRRLQRQVPARATSFPDWRLAASTREVGWG